MIYELLSAIWYISYDKIVNMLNIYHFYKSEMMWHRLSSKIIPKQKVFFLINSIYDDPIYNDELCLLKVTPKTNALKWFSPDKFRYWWS